MVTLLILFTLQIIFQTRYIIVIISGHEASKRELTINDKNENEEENEAENEDEDMNKKVKRSFREMASWIK